MVMNYWCHNDRAITPYLHINVAKHKIIKCSYIHTKTLLTLHLHYSHSALFCSIIVCLLYSILFYNVFSYIVFILFHSCLFFVILIGLVLCSCILFFSILFGPIISYFSILLNSILFCLVLCYSAGCILLFFLMIFWNKGVFLYF